MINVADYMDEGLVFFLSQASSRDEVIKTMIHSVAEKRSLPGSDAFYHAIVEREKLVSTGIGMGVSIPHAKLSGFDDFFIAIGILPKGVDWQSLDHHPVRIIFMIGGPDDKQTEYLQILSTLTQLIKNEETRKKLLTLNSKEAIIGLFKAK